MQLQQLSEQAPEQLEILKMDVADPDSIRACAADLKGKAIDILINNAGISGGNHQSMGDINVAEWLQTFKVNSIAPILVAQAFRPCLKAAEMGKVMTISSQLGATTWPGGGSYAYGSSKAAVNRASRSLALDLEPDGISVGVIHPGWVKTDMGGQAADLTPAESAAGICQVISGMKPENSGSFWKWNGEEHPW